jgi:hypothetical protein
MKIGIYSEDNVIAELVEGVYIDIKQFGSSMINGSIKALLVLFILKIHRKYGIIISYA